MSLESRVVGRVVAGKNILIFLYVQRGVTFVSRPAWFNIDRIALVDDPVTPYLDLDASGRDARIPRLSTWLMHGPTCVGVGRSATGYVRELGAKLARRRCG